MKKLITLSLLVPIQVFAIHTRGQGHEFAEGDKVSQSIVRIMTSSVCTGTFISKKTILTAAHCLSKVEPGTPVTVQTYNGSKINKSYKFKYEDTLQNLHPLYSLEKEKTDVVSNIPHDLAVLTLNKEISEAKPVLLYPSLETKKSAQDFLESRGIKNLYLAGNGTRKRFFLNPAIIADALNAKTRKVIAKFIDLERKGYFELEVLQKSKICKGDSGGPAYLTNANNDLIQFGVASVVGLQHMILSTNNCGTHASYTRLLDENLEWVIQTKSEQEENI